MSVVSNLNNSALYSVPRKALIGAIIAFASGCGDATGNYCSWENRYVGVMGRAYEGSVELANGRALLSGQRGSRVSTRLEWSITAPSVAGHVTSIALVSTDQSFPEIEVPFGEPFGSEYYGTFIHAPLHPNPALEGLFDPMATDQTAFRLTTDLPERPFVTIPLTLVTKLDWFRPNCYD